MVNKGKIWWGIAGLITSLIVFGNVINMFSWVEIAKGGFATWFFSGSFVPFALLIGAVIGGVISIFEIIKGARENG